MTEYINKAELKKKLKEETANEYPPFNLVTSYIKVVENMPTIEITHPPIVTEEITELNEENNRLFKENEKLKAKLQEINRTIKEETK